MGKKETHHRDLGPQRSCIIINNNSSTQLQRLETREHSYIVLGPALLANIVIRHYMGKSLSQVLLARRETGDAGREKKVKSSGHWSKGMGQRWNVKERCVMVEGPSNDLLCTPRRLTHSV